MLFSMLSQIVGYLISIVILLVIVQFVISLLFAFNVVSMHNQWAAAIYRSVNALLEPILRPIRRIMPDTGAIDFSPLVLIVLLNIVNIVFANLALARSAEIEPVAARVRPVGTAGKQRSCGGSEQRDAHRPRHTDATARLRSTILTMLSSTISTSGEKSIAPVSGMIRRIGRSTGSSRALTDR